MLKNIIVSTCLIFLFSCSHKALNVDHHIATTSELTPESSGHLLGGSLELEFHSDHKLNLVRSTQTSLFGNVSDTEINTKKSLEESGGLGFKGSLGLYKFVDYLIKSATESPTMHGIKIQILGGSLTELETGFKLAVAGMYGQGTDKEEGSFSLTVEDTGKSDFDNVSGEILIKQRELALLLGYRVTDYFLFFGSAFYTHVDSKATLNINSSSTFVLADSEYFSASLGGRMNTTNKKLNAFTQIEVGRSRGKIIGEINQTISAFSFSIGLTW